MPTHPTVQEAGAALEAALAAYDTAKADHEAAYQRLSESRVAVRLARKEADAAIEREKRNAIGRDRRKAKALARAYDISIDWDPYSNVPGDGVWWVLGPEAVYGGGDGQPEDDRPADRPVRADPCEGDHTAISWSEVLSNVEAYVADLQAWGGDLAKTLLEADESLAASQAVAADRD